MPYCPEIYKNAYIERFNANKIYVAPCCQATSKLIDNESFDFKNNSYLSNLREAFDNDENPKECQACWKVEELGHKSRRESAIEYHNNILDTSIDLESLDLNITWACNLACIMCGPSCSSSWAKELKLNKSKRIAIGSDSQKKNDIINNTTLDKIKKVHFNGGEPLSNVDHIQFLEKLNSQRPLHNIFLSYNTNGTFYPSDDTIKMWEQADLVKVFFSIDATNEAFNYIRYPANWESVEKNILDMKNNLPSNVMFGINATVGCYNLFEIADVKLWFDKNLSCNREGDKSDFNWQLAENFHPKYVKNNIKKAAIKILEKDNILNSISQLLKSEIMTEADYNWVNKLDEIDYRRNTDWKKTLEIGKYF